MVGSSAEGLGAAFWILASKFNWLGSNAFQKVTQKSIHRFHQCSISWQSIWLLLNSPSFFFAEHPTWEGWSLAGGGEGTVGHQKIHAWGQLWGFCEDSRPLSLGGGRLQKAGGRWRTSPVRVCVSSRRGHLCQESRVSAGWPGTLISQVSRGKSIPLSRWLHRNGHNLFIKRVWQWLMISVIIINDTDTY